jgi:YVTN family beta-propeller protein
MSLLEPADPAVSDYKISEAIKKNLADPLGFDYYRIYESDFGLSPECPAINPKNGASAVPCNMLGNWAKTGGIGMVLWSTHGTAQDANKLINSADNIYLDDSRPAFTFQASCSNGYPENAGNLGYSLLKRGAIATISGSRETSGATPFGDWTPNPLAGDDPNIGYHYAKRIMENDPAGKALYLVKSLSHVYKDHFALNLYGDPSVTLFGPADCKSYIFTANQASNDVTVIRSSDNSMVATIPAGNKPQFLTVNPSGTRVYVSTHSGVTSGQVTVIDPANLTVIANIPVGPNPAGMAITQDGNRLYVLNSGDNTMSVIDTASNAVIGAPIAVAAAPYDIVISPDGTRLYISSQNAGSIQVLNAATHQQLAPLLKVGASAAGLAISPSGFRLYVADFVEGNVKVVETSNFNADPLYGVSLSGTAPANDGAIALAVSPDGKRLYSANFGFGSGSTISIIDAVNNSGAGAINVGTSPHGLALDRDGTYLYAANQASDSISVVDLSKNTVTTVPVGSAPVAAAVVNVPCALH